jgi:uncharacterized protein YegL
MYRSKFGKWAALLLGSCALLAASPVPVVTTARASAPRQRAPDSPCTVEAQKVAYPRVLLMGESTRVTLTVKPTCPDEDYPLHIALVLDASGSMAGERNAMLKAAVKDLVAGLRLPDHPQIQVAVIEFRDVATVLCKLTNDEGQLIGCADRLDANGAGAIDAGIRAGMRELVAGRPRGAGSGAIREVMVVLADGPNAGTCDAVQGIAGQAKAQGILMISVCLGPDCDSACLRQAASSSRWFYQVDQARALMAAFARIRDEVTGIQLRRLTVTDVLAPDMQYIPDSAEPPPDKGDPASGFTWQTNDVGRDGITITYQVRPLEAGERPTSALATGELRDNIGRTRSFTLPVPYVLALMPYPPAARTDPPSTPTTRPPRPSP